MNILGYTYTIKSDNNSESISAYGRFQSKDAIIQIANDICRQQWLSTMLHEILEALKFHLELDLEHSTIAGLETGLYQVLTANGVDLTPLAKNVVKK